MPRDQTLSTANVSLNNWRRSQMESLIATLVSGPAEQYLGPVATSPTLRRPTSPVPVTFVYSASFGSEIQIRPP